MPIIQVKSLSKTFVFHRKEVGFKSSLKNLFAREKCYKDAVSKISFSIEEGEIVGFLGPNGAGKTTTLKMLSGILHPTSGDALVDGYVPWLRQDEYKKRFAIVMGQKNQLWWDLPANESLNLLKHIYEIDQGSFKASMEELCGLLEVTDLLNIPVRRLSLGERMKFELIASLIHRPRILFLDEPTIGLDILSAQKIRDFLKRHCRESRTTVLLTSHYMKDICDLCKRLIIINGGKIIFDNELSRINSLFHEKKVVRITFAGDFDPGLVRTYGECFTQDGNIVTLEVPKKNLSDISRQILASHEIEDFNIEDIPIEKGIGLIYQNHLENK
ncbi:MAG: ATP-binding cassette domain-containing protein [Oligoflexales bacterium]|nr:ATP-binding cassette domain-containing protein [Oligoflexales bacterium]